MSNQTATPWTWTKTDTGYKSSSGHAEMVKRGKKWFLLHAGTEHALPARPTFDHAEGILARLAGA